MVMPIFGTRPEAIKMAPVIAALATHERLDVRVAVTGQHREMLDQVNRVFGVQPAIDLNISRPGQTLTDITVAVMSGLADAFADRNRPDAVLVQGDTSTSTVAALSAYYHRIPVIHLEAGLRSGNPLSPFPEEGNRKVTGQLSALHLAPTSRSRANLLAENVPESDIVVTGNTVIDALLHVVSLGTPFTDERVAAAVESGRRIVVSTGHRRESWQSGLTQTARALARVAATHPDVIVVMPLHKNPIVHEAIEPVMRGLQNVVMTEPLDYPQFSHLLSAAHVIVTDSGGIQEEAPSLGKPVLVTRDTTERPEAVEAGAVRLIGTDENRVFAELTSLLDDPGVYRAMSLAVNPYGDGRAAERATAAIGAFLNVDTRLADFVAS
ncbi:MAG TPA: UDP-N-acetylglucosamine 2-epimerase (non-hydrolyzing) [Microbacteriaceae bacterium]|nr:UDP-N-acetylglucosamine 2-epimerase (non-hydrolyzing) [Microbacteriaceae bacterium]